ncbi:alpha/beta fold hydrolase [Pseudonocardia aurantiaca]|uniref:Alpha/beta fold hydrolase n=1 Tax=Pseudonocardia aurantiaca TaxID=75290 RepID=A0ABW4FX83_9PSEU
MTSGGLLAETLPARAKRIANELVRHFGPIAGMGRKALFRHPVWTTPAADGRGVGVVVVPGFCGADADMAVLRRWLTARDYHAVGAGLALNLGCTEDMLGKLERRVEAHVAATGGPVVLLGHSRGGWLGRLLAVRRPDLVRGLVMMGSPVLDPLDARGLASVAWRLMVRLSDLGVRGLLERDCVAGECREVASAGLAAPLEVPAMAIFSRTDGVVGWESCRDPAAEWVEVYSSHTGMGTDPDLYMALVPRLAAWASSAQGPSSSTLPESSVS